MTNGRLFAVVGPSGAGKDTLLEAVRERIPKLRIVKRVITRPESLGGEPFQGVDRATFDARLADGGFALWWEAHGLRYGIPSEINVWLREGATVVFNGSRGMLAEAQRRYPDMGTILITAKAETLARRLAARGRESEEDIKARLARADTALPDGLNVIAIDNDGELDVAVSRLETVLQPASK